MAVAFTSLASWEHAQDTTAAQEIILAYSERRQCVGDAAIDDLEPGDVKQDTTFWRGVQDWVESKCTRWVDDSSFSGAASYSATTDITYTLSTFRTAAGLDTDGFRRATEWPTDWTNPADAAYSFGKITQGDIVGPWIFEDLQKAFDAMRWTCASQTESSGTFAPVTPTLEDVDQRFFGTGRRPMHPTANAAYTDLATEWPLASIVAGNRYYATFMEIELVTALTPNIYTATAKKDIGEIHYNSIPTHIDHSASIYIRFGEGSEPEFYDIDSLGVNETDIYLKESYALSNSNSRILYALEDADISIVPPNLGVTTKSIAMVFDFVLLKWDFTNTL